MIFIHSLTHSFTHSFMNSFNHSFIHSFIHSFHSFIHSFIHFMHSFIHSISFHFKHSFIHAFIHSFIQSFNHDYPSLRIRTAFVAFLADFDKRYAAGRTWKAKPPVNWNWVPLFGLKHKKRYEMSSWTDSTILYHHFAPRHLCLAVGCVDGVNRAFTMA